VPRIAAIALTLLVTWGRGAALAWGCHGHQAIGVLAQRLLDAAAVQAIRSVLDASPVDPGLRRGCEPVPSEVVADASTWADDERAADPATGSWHFVNLPRSIDSKTASAAPYCRRGDCVVDAVTTQFRVLKTSRDPTQRANALRFIIHLVGDIHQPLHAITNGDRGGNCFPVAYLARSPEQDERGTFSPNLHAVWDSGLIATIMKAHGLADARALAGYLASQGAFPPTVTASAPTTSSVTLWARDSHALARSVAYGRLPVAVPMESAAALTLSSCADNRDVAHRLLALRTQLGEPYERAADTVIVDRLRLASMRLAAVLKSAFSSP